MSKNNSVKRRQSWFRKHWLISLGIAFLVVMMIGGYGMWRFYQYYRSSERFIQLAEELRQEDEYQGALDQYGRALRYADSHAQRVDILNSMIDTIKERPSRAPREAQQAYYEIDSLRLQIIRLQPDRTDISNNLLKEHFKLSQRLNAPWAWQQLEELADTVLGFKEEHKLAHQYKTIAQIFTVSDSAQTKKYFREKYETLQEMMEDKPDDETLVYYSSIVLLKRAELFNQPYERNRRNELIEEADQLMSDYLEEHTPSRQFKLYNIRFLLQKAMTRKDLKKLQPIYDETLKLAEEIRKSDDKSLGSKTAELFLTLARIQRIFEKRNDESLLDVTQDDIRQKSLELVENVSGNDAGNLESKLIMARIYEEDQQHDKAISVLEDILDPDYESPISSQALFDAHSRFKARYELADIYLNRCERTEIEEQRKEWMAKIKDQLQKFKDAVGEEHPYVISIEGRIAFLNNNYQEAAQKFQDARQKLGGQLPQSLLYYGMTLVELGESGIAIQQLVEYLSRPDLPPENRRKALNYLSQCAIQLQQLDQAAEISRRLLKQYPEEPDVKLTLGRSLLLQIMRSGRSGNEEIVKEAIENLRPLAENGNEEAIEQLAQIYMYSGELDDAAELLVNHCDQHPRDARALSLLYTVLVRQNEYDEAEERLQRAVEESPDNKASEHLLAGLDGDGEWKDYILDLLPLALENEEVERQIGLLRFYRMRGRDEMADEMFDKLVDNHPKDPRVLEEQFSRLLDEEKWQTAEEVHQKFKDTVDNELEPILWEARLYIARENYNEAIELLENELADDTPLSEAWAVLGNAYRGLGDYSKAQATLEKALERNPANHRALRHIIAVCDARGFRRQALSYMRRGLHFAPNDQQLVRLFLNYLEDYESPSQALNLRLQIASRQPGNRENRRAIARLYMKTDDLESAKNVIDGLYNENPDDLQTVVLLARYHALTGDVSKGKSTIKTYLEAQDERSAGDLLQYASFLIQYGEEQEKVEKIVNEAIEIESEENREATQFYATWLMDRDEHEKAKDIYQTLHKDIGDDKFLLSAAEADLELGEAEQAKETVNNYLQDNQMSVQAANLKTRIHISLQEYTQARRTIDRAIEQAPDNVRSRMLRAELGIRSSSHVSGDRIRNDLEKALEIDPDNDSARRTLVSWLMNEGKEDQAISHMEELIKENPESSEARDLLANLYFQQQEYSKLESMLNEWKEVTDDESLRILHWEGRLAEAQEDWEKAIDYFQTLIAEDSSENNLARYLNILIKADRPDEAISEFENYEDETQQDLDVLLQYGRALAVKGDTREAREPLAEAVKLADDDERRKYEMLRNVRSILDRESWNKFLHDDISVSDDAVISYFLAEEDLRNGGSEKAMSRLEKIKEDLDTDNFLYPRVLISLSDTYIQLDKNEKAADFLEEALEIAPDNPRVLNNLAYQMALLNRDPYKAIELADRALENISEEGEMRANILDTRGFAQFKAGLYAHAQTSYTNSLRNHPTAVAYTHLGELYLEQDKPVAAKRMLDLAMEIGKEQDEMSDKVRKDIDDLMKQADERVKAMDEEERKAELDEESDEIEEIEEAGDE